MKDMRDVKKEYGYVLRWINGGSSDGIQWECRFYLEDIETFEQITIIDDAALKFIESKGRDAFRHSLDIYDNYVELFNILSIKPLKSFNDLLEEKEISGNKLSKLSGVPTMTISDIRTRKTDFRKVSVETAVKLSKALGMTVEEIYSYLYMH